MEIWLPFLQEQVFRLVMFLGKKSPAHVRGHFMAEIRARFLESVYCAPVSRS